MRPLSCLCLVLSSCLSLTTAVPTSPSNTPQADGNVVNQTICNGKQYTYQRLAGYGFVPSNARDRYGDTVSQFRELALPIYPIPRPLRHVLGTLQ